MTESALTRLWCAKLSAAGASVLPVVAGVRGRSGWPDRYVAYDGGAVWLEFKAHDGRLSPEQRAVMAHLINNGARVYVARFSDATKRADLRIEYLDGVLVELCITARGLLEFIASGR